MCYPFWQPIITTTSILHSFLLHSNELKEKNEIELKEDYKTINVLPAAVDDNSEHNSGYDHNKDESGSDHETTNMLLAGVRGKDENGKNSKKKTREQKRT